MSSPNGGLARLPDDLAPEPAAGTGGLIGYARHDQGPEPRSANPGAEGSRVYPGVHRQTVRQERRTARTRGLHGLPAAREHPRSDEPGPVPPVAADLIATVADLRCRGARFKSMHGALDTTIPGGRLVFHVFAALAEFIVEAAHEGLNAAPACGVRLDRPPAMTPEQIQHARDLLARPGNTGASIARLIGVSWSTIYKYVPEITNGNVPADGRPLPDVAKFELLPSRLAAGEGGSCPMRF